MFSNTKDIKTYLELRIQDIDKALEKEPTEIDALIMQTEQIVLANLLVDIATKEREKSLFIYWINYEV